MEEVLEEPSNDMPAENYLLVGSDSRESVDADDPNAGAIGSAEDAVDRRSDTIMVLRRERNGGASLLSLPRDLWVPIAGTDHRRRSTRPTTRAPERAGRHGQQALGIPINHYVEIDFAGFQKLVDEIGGVEVCTYVPAQDTHSGLDLAARAATILDGVAGPRLRPQPALRGVDRRRVAGGRHAPTSAASSASSCSSAPPSKALLQKVESDPFASAT